MRYLDTFERKVVFPSMRVIAIVAIIGLLIAAAISFVSLSIDTATAADRTQQAQAIKERISERRQDAQDVRGNVSATMTEIKESKPKPETREGPKAVPGTRRKRGDRESFPTHPLAKVHPSQCCH